MKAMSALPKFLKDLESNFLEDQSPHSAWLIIEKYMGFFGADGVNEDLWGLTVAALSSEQVEDMDKGLHRYNLLFFYEYTIMFINAVSFLNERHLQKKKNGKKQNTELPKSNGEGPLLMWSSQPIEKNFQVPPTTTFNHIQLNIP